VNIARYPHIGRTLDVAQEAKPAATAGQPQTPDQTPPAKTSDPADPSPARTEVGAAAAEVVPPAVAKHASTTDGGSIPATSATPPAPAAPIEVTVPITDVQPTAPIGGLPTKGENALADHEQVRRLPPVETSGLAANDRGANPADAGAAYPTTATP
jgi:hypothetical protein